MVYLTEDDRAEHRGAGDVLMERVRQEELAGATMWRGVEGFGRSGEFRADRLPDSSAGLPLVFEMIDSAENADRIVELVRSIAPGSLVTREPVALERPDVE